MKKSIFIIFLFVSNLFAQQVTDKNLYLTSNKVDVSAYYQSLKIGDSVLSQIAFPINITIPVGMRMSFSIYNGLALSKYEDTEINGLGDTKIGFRYFIPGDKFVFRAIASIPTGITELDPEQFILSQILAQNPLSYPVTYYGQGFNTSLSLAYATPITKAFVVGAGVVYNYRGKFTPLQNYGEFKPGDEITADIGFEVKASNNLKFNFDVLYTIFSKDKMDNVDIFQFGNRLSLFAGVKLKTGDINHNLFVVTRIREDSKFFTNDNEEEILKNGSQVNVNYVGLMPITPKLSITVKLDGKIYGTYDQFLGGKVLVTGEATVIGCTAGAKLFLSDLISSDLNLGYKVGSIILPNFEVSSNISGFLANLGFTFRF
jgi:hypothetical protein